METAVASPVPARAATTPRSLLAAVARRLYWIRCARLAWILAVVFIAVAAAALATVRLTGLVAIAIAPSNLALLPLAALAIAILVARRPAPAAVARLVDRRLGADDLFLTFSSLATAPGEFRDLVARQADARAADAKPQAIQRLDPWRGLASAGLALAALAAGLRWLPVLDPFGRQAELHRLAGRQAKLDVQEKETKRQIEAMSAHDAGELNKAVQQELKKLVENLQAMKVDDRAGNRDRLDSEQAKLGKLYNEERAERFASSQERENQSAQQLGGGDRAQAEELKKAIEQGKREELKREIGQLQQLAKELADAQTPEEQKRLRQELQQKLENLAEASKQSAPALSSTAQRALEQLAQAADSKLSSAAQRALSDSLALAELQMAKLGQSADDQRSLEQALATIQRAKQLNDQGQLGPGDKATLEEYRQLYEELMAEREANADGSGKGKGKGKGKKGGKGQAGDEPGEGDGGNVGEDDAAKTGFQKEQEHSQLTAGKMLMQWKTHGPTEAGKADENYQQALRDVKQGMTEALEREQVPPGYHQAVQRYFDDLTPDAAGDAAAPASGK